MDIIMRRMEIELDRRKALIDQAREALREMLKAYEQLLPGIGKIACRDYRNINEAPIKARQTLAAMEAPQ